MKKQLIAFSTALTTLSSAYAVELSGSVGIEGRAFLNRHQFDGQKNGSGFSATINPEFFHEFKNGKDSIAFEPFLRLDPQDSDREHVDVRELKWLHVADDWELSAGVDKVFWGVTESNHLVDIINQTDAVESPDQEDKLGQPMIQYGMFKDWGTVRAFVMPYFRERTYVSSEGRLRGGVPVDTDNAVYESGLEERHPDFALRYEHTFGDWDVGVAHFSGTSREARLVADTNAGGQNVLIPHYDLIDQTSVDVQLTTESVLWKLEAFSRSGQGERFTAAVGGLEYTFYGVMDSTTDVGFLAEYHLDDRSTSKAPGTIFDDDIFFATRIAWNDVDDSELLAGILFDREEKNRSFSVEYEQRIGNNWEVTAEGRFFAGFGGAGDVALTDEDYLQLTLTRYF